MKRKNEINSDKDIGTKVGTLCNSLFAKQEAGEPFYIIDTIENNMCSCDIYATHINNKTTPILFLDKNFAETIVKLLHDDSITRHMTDNRQVTGLSNFYFNVIYAISNEKTICFVTHKQNSQGLLELVPYTLGEIREKFNLKTTHELNS